MRITAVKPIALLFPSLHRTKHANFVHFTSPLRYSSPSTAPTKTLNSLFHRRPMTAAAAAVSSSSSPPVQVREKIELTDVEKQIFDRLLGTLRHFGLENQLRVAGGWVRDKVFLSTSFSGEMIMLLVWLCLLILIFEFSASRQRLL